MKVVSFKESHINQTMAVLRAYGLDVGINIIPYRGTDLSTPDTIVQGFLQQSIFNNRTFNIFITKDFSVNFKRFILHECAHIQQYVEGKLSVINGKEYWNEVEIDLTKKYKWRPHEKDARKRARKMKRKMRKEKLWPQKT